MSTHALSAPISSLSLLLVQSQVARSKAASSEQLTGAHFYLDIAKSCHFLHGSSGGMNRKHENLRNDGLLYPVCLILCNLSWLCYQGHLQSTVCG